MDTTDTKDSDDTNPPSIPNRETRFDRVYRWIAFSVMFGLLMVGVIYVAMK